MLDFSFEMHQIQFRRGLLPDATRGAYRACRPPSWIWGKDKGKEKKEKESKGRGKGEKKKREKGEGRGRGFSLPYLLGVRGYCSLHIKQGNARAQPIDGLFPRL